ncbi:pseudouridine synthase [Aquidulcibacter sp.]|uniref:pseudouridine synthase n=1 Tax=Aquidulcibacter sp. TaxID=2052990 RepID=UPI0025B99518|nr:pseudouridine synthase [Aquidulcibacter sp.]MCA3693901.1 pseudouridine synthase [Aquidulcibacter sp.]
MTFDPSDESPRKKGAQDAKPWQRKPLDEAPPPAAQISAERPGERIAKALARAGLCSRREAERWIEEGRITVNGVVLESPAFNVTAQDRIAVDGRPVDSPEPTRLWRYHKPDGLVTTHKDPQGRETVFDHLPEDLPRVISVGRLDLSSEGLLLLTNDGGLARSLELPSTGWLRRYRVRAFGRVSQEELAKLADGITVDGITYGPMEAILDRAETANAWITVSIREGKNREVRRVLEAIGLKVNRLIRVSYGPFQLGKMPPGSVEEVAPSALKEMLGALMPDLPPRFSSRPARPARPVVEAPAPAKTGRRGPKPPPKSAKTRVSLLEEETMRREAGKAKSRAAHAGAGALPAKGKSDWAGKAKAGQKKPFDVGHATKGKPQLAPRRAGDGPKRAQASTKPRKPSR